MSASYYITHYLRLTQKHPDNLKYRFLCWFFKQIDSFRWDFVVKICRHTGHWYADHIDERGVNQGTWCRVCRKYKNK